MCNFGKYVFFKEDKMNLLLKNIIYYVVAGVGFFSLNMFGIGYNSPIISIAAIPMMIILSVYTLYI